MSSIIFYLLALQKKAVAGIGKATITLTPVNRRGRDPDQDNEAELMITRQMEANRAELPPSSGSSSSGSSESGASPASNPTSQQPSP